MRCEVCVCERAAVARGMCHSHWREWRKTVDVLPPTTAKRGVPPRPLSERPGCSAAECDRLALARSMCGMHYSRWQAAQKLPKPPYVRPIIPVEERFWAKVDRRGPDECWHWTAGQIGSGYGGFHPTAGAKANTVSAHKFSYELAYGPVPDGLWIDHACHNGTDCVGGDECLHRRCVNPAHLEAVPPSINSARSHRHRGTQSHCANGHEYTPKTTRLLADKGVAGWRICTVCERDNYLRSQERASQRAGQPIPDGVAHGTFNAYNSYKCRCQPCRDNWATYMRARRARLKSEGVR